MARKQVQRAGVVDIGSNSLRLIIGEKAGDQIKTLEFLKKVVPIGKDVFYKERISQETINSVLLTLQKFKKALQEYDISSLKVFATTAVREARNRDLFLDVVKRNIGFEVEVFNVGDIIYHIDSYIHYTLRDTYPIHEKNLLVVELGAGSVDIAVIEKGFMLNSVGMPLGTLRLKRLLNTLEENNPDAREGVREYIANEFQYLKRLIHPLKIDDMILISEDFTYCAQNVLGGKKREEAFYPFTREQSELLVSKCAGKSPDELSHLYAVPGDTAEVLEVLSLVINNLFSLVPGDSLYVLQTSLYEAVLTHMLAVRAVARTYKEVKHLVYIARHLCMKYNVDLEHAKATATLSHKIFMGLYQRLGLKRADVLYLVLAAYLHDIGLFISNRAHHKHTDYIIRSLNLFRMKEQDIRLIATIARYHRKSQRFESDPNYLALSVEEKLLVLKLSALLRIANALDRSHRQKIKRLEVVIDKGNDVQLRAAASGNCVLERWSFEEKKNLFEEITGSKIGLKVETE